MPLYNGKRSKENETRNFSLSKIESFEDLLVWKESMKLIKEIHNSLDFNKYNPLINQIFKSAISIPSNIAEGFERQTNKEYIQFLYIAKGSSAELRTQLKIASDIGKLTISEASNYRDKTKKISSMLFKLIQTRKENFK